MQPNMREFPANLITLANAYELPNINILAKEGNLIKPHYFRHPYTL